MGIGAESSNNLYSCMSYYANEPGDANKKFKAAYFGKFGDKAPQLAIIGADCYSALNVAKALVDKAGGTNARKMMTASNGLAFDSAAGRWTMHGQHVDKNHVHRILQGHRVRDHQDHRTRETRQGLQGLTRPGPR